MKLWLVRHAKPLIEAGVCYGATDLSADLQASRTSAAALSAILPVGLPVFFSPLQRCEQLVHILKGLRPDLSFSSDDRLVEMDFGCWEGVRWDQIPKAEIDLWTAAFASHRFGGRESVNELMARVRWSLQDTALSGPQAVWISHAGVIRAASLIAQGLSVMTSAAQWPKEVTAFGQWTELEVPATALEGQAGRGVLGL